VKALVLAAGEGTRLRPLTADRPKAMVEIGGEPAVVHTLRWLRREGVTDVAINLCHHPETLTACVGDGAAFGLRVTYSLEPTALGTSGALGPLRGYFATEAAFVVVYGDELTDLGLAPVLAAHRRARADATVVVTPVEDPSDAGIFDFGPDGLVTGFVEKPHPSEVSSRWANGGIYLCGPAVLAYVPREGPQDFARDVFPAMLRDGRRVVAFPTREPVIDFGTPERLALARAWLASRRGQAPAAPAAAPRPSGAE
jgi:mannose-1-phosphate guanylyltransferase